MAIKDVINDDDELNINPPTPGQIGKRPLAPNPPAIRESQAEGICGVIQRSAAVGVLWGIWRRLGWGEGGWVVLWGIGRYDRRCHRARNLPVL